MSTPTGTPYPRSPGLKNRYLALPALTWTGEPATILRGSRSTINGAGRIRPQRRNTPRRRGGLGGLDRLPLEGRNTPASAGRTPATGRRGARIRSSPPTRGCSAGGGLVGRGPPVLPADAGVFRNSRPRRRPSAGPPRRRGGVPSKTYRKAQARASSPPTRGCSDTAVSGPSSTPVLPADAGVFLRRRPPADTRGRPPRRRGGVPPHRRGGPGSSRSSPPTRGCSDGGNRDRGWVSVLPADAGVFRRRQSR